MRASTLLRRLIGIEGLVVTGAYVELGALVAQVRPSWCTPRCSRCGRKARTWELGTEDRRWRHLDLAGVVLYLEYDRQRAWCRRCGWVVEAVPWADEAYARFTREFDECVAFLAQRCDKSSIERAFRIAWRTIGRCIERVVRRLRSKDPLANLRTIGVDEISYRKFHHYLTVVTDLERGVMVWAKEGRNAKTLAAFFEELGEQRCRLLRAVTMDMAGGYIKAVGEKVPDAQLIFDRFHVQRLVSDAVDETRREEWRRLRLIPQEAAALKHTRWALLKHPGGLTEKERIKLATIQHENKRLYRAYLLKEQFVEIMERRQPNVAARMLEDWLAWASRSRLPAFVKTARTIREHRDGILAYIRWRLTNGVTEGLNTKARLITRRAYGFHTAEAFIAMLTLCCTDIDVRPPLKEIG